MFSRSELESAVQKLRESHLPEMQEYYRRQAITFALYQLATRSCGTVLVVPKTATVPKHPCFYLFPVGFCPDLWGASVIAGGDPPTVGVVLTASDGIGMCLQQQRLARIVDELLHEPECPMEVQQALHLSLPVLRLLLTPTVGSPQFAK